MFKKTLAAMSILFGNRFTGADVANAIAPAAHRPMPLDTRSRGRIGTKCRSTPVHAVVSALNAARPATGIVGRPTA